jgi:DNA-binding transcriptional LysR family regulator
MEWQQLLGFYHVARLGSFTKAGEATFRSQSALSQQIKALEEELGCRLLERIGKRKLRLTSPGERFFRFAQESLARYEQLQEELHELQGLQKGHVRLAAPFTTLYHLFPPVLKRYRERFPQVQLTVWDRSQATVLELIRAGDIDLGIALESVVPQDLAATRWQAVDTVLMAPRGHPLTRAKSITLEQIAAYPLILPPRSPGHSGRGNIQDYLRKEGLDYRVIMESSNVELSSLYVEMGLGISFATMVQGLRLPRRKLAFISLKDFFPPDYMAVVMRKDKTLTPPKAAFIQMLLGSDSEQ